MKLKKPLCNGLVLTILSLASAQTRANHAEVQEAPGNLPLRFEINQGQTDHRVKFVSRGSGYTLFLTSTEAVLSLRRQISRTREESTTSPHRQLDALGIKLGGANPAPNVIGLDELPGKSNYFIGNNPRKWQTNISAFSKVRYQDVYPGIDLIYYGNQRQLEHDFIVAPGARPSTIRLSIRGATKSRIDSNGDLVLSTPGGTVSLHRPCVYQDGDSGRQPIMGRYAALGRNQVGFEIAEYDVDKPLIIDPVLSYSTYLGGSSDDIGYGIAVDSAGNAYLTGQTASTNFPTAGPIQSGHGGAGSDDVFVTKLNAAGGALVYSTYLGGSGEDVGFGVAVDAAGNAYVAGLTASTNFPTTLGSLQTAYGGGPDDVFISKLNSQGNALLYSTFLGGGGDDIGNGIAVDSAGNAYVIGQTASTNFPTTPGSLQTTYGGGPGDAFISKLNSQGNALVYSTFLGGRDNDFGNGIAIDSSGNAYLTGVTNSANFPTMPNAFQSVIGGGNDAFVAKLNVAGNVLVYSTYLGGRTNDLGIAIAVDSASSAYVTGTTDSTDFPTKNPFQATWAQGLDAFASKFDSTGALAYSTYLGGTGPDRGFAIAVDSAGNAYIAGRTDSTDFPTERPIQTAPSGGPGHAFVTELNAAGNALTYSTYLGGNGKTRGFGIALDSRNNAYLTGFTDSTNFQTTTGAVQAANRGMADVIVSKINDSAPDFVVTAAGGSHSASVTCGQTANYDLQVVPVSGFTGSVSIGCVLTPQGMASTQGLTCRPSTNPVNVANGAARFSVSVGTTGRSLLPPMTTRFAGRTVSAYGPSLGGWPVFS